MYVKVKFFRKSANGYVGNAYTYETDLPLRVMDRVTVPAGTGKNGKRKGRMERARRRKQLRFSAFLSSRGRRTAEE